MKRITSLLLSLIVLPLQADDTIAIDAELQKKWPNNRTVNIIFHGHSVPSGYHLSGNVKPFESYPHLLRVKLANDYPFAVCNVITTSIGGEHSVDGALRFASDVLPLKPDLIFIDYGLNDRDLTLAETETAWKDMVAIAKTNSIPVVLITPTGASNADFSDPTDPLSERAALIRTIADEEDVMLADVSAAWQAALDSGTDENSLLSQGNHPNLAGHNLATDILYQTYRDGFGAGTEKVLLAASFPSDGSTNTFQTTDQLVTFTTTNFFSVFGNFVGDGGGTGNKVNTWDGSETLQIELAEETRLNGFAVRWSNSDIVISGFDSDPEAVVATVNGGAGSATWDGSDNTLTLSLPWDAGIDRDVTFQNPSASLNKTLNLSFTRDTAGWQTAFTQIRYDEIDELTSFLFSPNMQLGEDLVTFPFPGLANHSYFLQESSSLLPDSWQIITGAGPLTTDRLVTLADSEVGDDRIFYRIAVSYP